METCKVKTGTAADLIRHELETYGLPAILEWVEKHHPGLFEALAYPTEEPSTDLRTPTRVSRFGVADQAQRIGRSADIFSVGIERKGCVVTVIFDSWPDAWRGKWHIIEHRETALYSDERPSMCGGVIEGPGKKRHCDGWIVCDAWGTEEGAKSAFAYIVALMEAALVLAESELVEVE